MFIEGQKLNTVEYTLDGAGELLKVPKASNQRILSVKGIGTMPCYNTAK